MKSVFLSSYFTEVKDLFVDYIKNNHKNRIVTFIPTAAIPEEYKFHVTSDMNALKDCGFEIEILDISVTDENTIKNQINKNDFLFVSGGNTFYLLQELKRKNADIMIIDFINENRTYIGSSAGSIILTKDIKYIEKMDNKAVAKDLTNNRGLGIIDFYLLPHYKSEPFTDIAEEIYNDYKSIIDIKPITNQQAFVYSDATYVLMKKKYT